MDEGKNRINVYASVTLKEDLNTGHLRSKIRLSNDGSTSRGRQGTVRRKNSIVEENLLNLNVALMKRFLGPTKAKKIIMKNIR